MMRSKRGEEMTMEEIESNGVISSSTGAASSRNHLEAVKQPSSSSSSSSKKGGSKDEEAKTIPYYRLFSFVDSFDVMLMIIGTIGAIGNGVSLPVMTLLFGNIVNSFGDNPEHGEMLAAVAKVSLQFVYLAIGNGIASALQVICWSVTGERQTSRIRNMYLETILRQDIAFFDKDTNSGEVIERISGDTFLIQDAMGEKVGKFVQFLATFFGGFVVSFVQGWLLTLVMLTIIPPLVFSGALLAQVLTRMAIQGQNAYTEAANIADQTISSIRTVASFTGEKKAINKYNKSIKIAAKASVRKGIATGLGAGAVMFVMFCGYSLGVWYGGKLILSNGYTGGHVITVILALISASFTLGQAVPCMTAFSKGQAAGYKMFETINRKPEIDSYDNSGKMMDDIQGDIELRNVVFSYPTRPNEKIFSGFSLSINNGMSVALVGESGSGKSTVISLIERFYDPQSGQVLIDNINIKEFQLRWIRSKIGLVSQEPVLFLSSIRENIAYGSNGATFEEIKAVAELANASKFIDKMPQGFETMVGENGTQLSGGQKQRIAIARAILKDPKILLLDEATSALDAESERIVQEALDRVITNRTTVMVAHRLSTVKNADMIVVIHRGAIVEKGSHSELCHDQNGAYSQLIRLQEVNKDSNANDLDGTYSARSLSTLNRSLKHRSLSQKNSTGNNNQQNSLTDESMAIPISSKYTESREQTQKASIRQLVKLNKPEIPVLILGAIAAIIQGLIMPIFGLLLSQVIGAFYKPPDQLKKETRFWALMLIIAGLVSLFIYPVKVSLFAFAGSELVKRVRSMCFEKVVYMEVGWFDNSNNSSGAIGTRLSTDSESVRGIVGDSLAFIVMNTASMVAGLVISFTASWKLSLIVLALAPLIGLSEYVQMNFIKGFGDDAKTMYEDASQVANDAVRNIRTVASFSAEENVIELYKKKCEIPMKLGIRTGLVAGIGFGVAFFIIYCVYAVVFYVGAKFINDGTTTLTDLFKVFFSLSMAATAISQSSSFGPDTAKARSATRSIFRILDRKSAIESNDDLGMVLEQVRGSIEFQNVKFTYPTRPDVQIFRDISFIAHSGKVTALVGESGCGKSTVISLLQRFYDPNSGEIFLDGIDTKKLKLQWLRQQIGLVSQEPVLFNDTIRANIAYGGKEGETVESDIIASAEFANAHKFISGLEQGYDTIVGERGIQLSGGQKQRVAIARAILKEPKILLLDEATSALDAESERVVQDALERVMVNRTTIVVAHRLSTIKGADMIAVVKDGSIVEKGKHSSLINIKNGAYASLVALQDTPKD